MKRIVAGLFCALVIQGCGVGVKPPRNPHESAPATTNDRNVVKEKAFHGLDLDGLRAASLEHAEALAAVILNQDNLSNTEFKGDLRAIQSLEILTQQLAALHKSSPDDPRLLKLLEIFRARILEGCRGPSMTGCRNVNFMTRDSGVASVLKILALQTNDPEAYFQLLGLCYEAQGYVTDKELENMVYTRMLDYLRVFVTVNKSVGSMTLTSKAVSDERKNEFRFYTTFIASVLSTSKDVQLTIEQALELVKWSATGQLETVAGRQLAHKIDEMVAAQLQQPDIWNEFTKVFEKEEAAETLSYTNSLARLDTHDPDLLKQLGVAVYDVKAAQDSHSRELAAMMFLSRVFNLRPVAPEKYLWKFSGLSDERALEIIESFVRVTLVDRTIVTHKRMAEGFKEIVARGRVNQELLDDTMRFATENLTPMWRDYVSRIQKIEEFFNEQIERPHQAESGTDLGLKIQHVRNMFEELNPNIKIMATYPNLFMLGYYAAKMNLRMIVEGMGGVRFEINKDLVMHDLMEGSMPPLFQFTAFRASEGKRNEEKLDQVQVLWALHYAMAMDIPGIYGIKADDFLSTFVSAYKARSDKRLRDMIKRQDDLLREGTDLPRLLEYCQSAENSVRRIPINLQLAQLRGAVVMGEVGEKSLTPLLTASSMFSYEHKAIQLAFDESIETIRSDVDPQLRRLYLIKAAMQEAKSTDPKQLETIDVLIDETIELRNRVVESTRSLIDGLPDCMLKMHDFEETRRRELLNMEIAHLKYVQIALQTVSGRVNEAEGLQLLKDGGGFFKDLDTSLPAEKALNQLFEKATHFEFAFNQIKDYREDYHAKAGFRRRGSGQLYYSLRREDMLVRVALNMMNGFDGAVISGRFDDLRIVWPNSLKEFITVLGNPISGKSYEAHFGALPGDAILRTGLIVFRDSFSWLTDRSDSIKYYRAMLRMRTAMMKFDYIRDLKGEDGEAREIRFKAQTEDLLNLTVRMLNQLSLRAGDPDLLGLFDAPAFYNIAGANSGNYIFGPQALFVKSSTTGELLGLADEGFLYVTSVRLGFTPYFRHLRDLDSSIWEYVPPEGNRGTVVSSEQLITRTNYIDRSRSYYKSLRDQDRLLLFSMPEDIKKQINDFQFYMIHADLKMSEDFVKNAEEWQKNNPLPMTQFSLRMPSVQMPLLSSTLLGNYRMQIIDFHNETDHVFEIKSVQQ